MIKTTWGWGWGAEIGSKGVSERDGEIESDSLGSVPPPSLPPILLRVEGDRLVLIVLWTEKSCLKIQQVL